MKFFKSPAILVASLLAVTIQVQADASPVNINTASAETIDKSLVFVGADTAKKIVRYREQNGAFQRLNDLARVKGVSKRLVRYNRALIRLQ